MVVTEDRVMVLGNKMDVTGGVGVSVHGLYD